MPFPVEHEIHKRRFGRNVGVGLLLVGMVGIVFALTVVKVTRGMPLKGFDHVMEPELAPAEGTE
jgi:hypothetical protein